MILVLDISEPVFVPSGSDVIVPSPLVVKIPEYDYGPFSDPESPAFDFIADKLYPDGTIVKDVPCTSLPGRTTVEKEPYREKED